MIKSLFILLATVLIMLQIVIPLNTANQNQTTLKSNLDSFDSSSTNDFVITFNENVTHDFIKQFSQQYDLTCKKQQSNQPFYVITLQAKTNTSSFLDIFHSLPTIKTIEPNYQYQHCMIPNDENYTLQWHLHNSSQGGINIEPAWDISTGENVIVAVMDTGISQGTDLNETLFVQGYDFINNDTDPTDDNGHGTHVAGTIAQSTNNTLGVCGVAYHTKLMPIKVLNHNGDGTLSTVVSGIYYAVDNGAHIISMSLSGPDSETMKQAVAYAYHHNVTVIAAAGNGYSNSIRYPAAYDDYVIAVGATRYDKTKAPYSNYGSSLDIVAPGGDLSVDQNNDGNPDGVYQQTIINNEWGYHFYEGTSMATPHVSGVAALIYSLGITQPKYIRAVLESTTIDLGIPGRDNTYGYGLLNAFNAVFLVANNQPPQVQFTTQQQGLTVTYNDTTNDPDNNILQWFWDFGDGNTSTQQNPNHKYQNDGTYPITLTVTDTTGTTNTNTTILTVANILPIVQFTYQPTEPYTYEIITLQDNTTDTDGTIVNWTWDFGDGNSSYHQHSNYTYQHNGNYTITLTVQDNDKAIQSISQNITINNQKPLASFNFTPNNPSTNQPILFTDTSTDYDGKILNWTWDFDDGTTSFHQHPTHNYSDNGTYTISLTIKDDDSDTHQTFHQVTILNVEPKASFFFTPPNPSSIDIISFTDTSTDTDGVIVNWTWDFNEGNISYEQHPSHRYQQFGNYTINLFITDDDGATHKINNTVSINNIPPTAQYQITPTVPTTIDTISFIDQSFDLDGTIQNRTWDLGDGAKSYDSNITHHYQDNGTYQVTLTVTDNNGKQDTSKENITIIPICPKAFFNNTPQYPKTIDSIFFQDLSSDSDGTLINWSWDFGDGNTSFSQHPIHKFTDNGSYTISLTVTDDDYLQHTYQKNLLISNLGPKANFSYQPYTPTTQDTITFMDTSLDSDGFLINWSWDFGDGNTSTINQPNHTYDNGYYTIILTVWDDDGAYDTYSDTITVLNMIPQADFMYSPEHPTIKDTISFTDLSNDSDGELVNWTWDFGDGNISFFQHPTHIYDKSGTYHINLTITDDDIAIHTKIDTLQIEKQTQTSSGNKPRGSSTTGGYSQPSNTPPIAEITMDNTRIFTEKSILFNGSLSTDSDGEIVNWTWDFGDGEIGFGNIIHKTFFSPGKYMITLTVNDDKQASDTCSVEIEILTPNVIPTTPNIHGPKCGHTFTSYSFELQSMDANNDNVSYIIDWGDGTNTTSDFVLQNTTISLNHSYTLHGKYVIAVKSFDGQNESEEQYLTIYIDVWPIDDVIQGYLIDQYGENEYTIFVNIESGIKTDIQKQQNDSYLIDFDGDGTWDYVFDLYQDSISYYYTVNSKNLFIDRDTSSFNLILILSTLIFVSLITILRKIR